MSSDIPQIVEVRKDDPEFPWRLRRVLGAKTPSRLFLQGNTSLLDQHAISFCGSRDATEKGIGAAVACARSAVSEGYVITSGNARGVDRATHRAALENGGSTIFVLPEGIDRFRPTKEVREFWDWERVLVISQFDRSAIWRAYQAMNRNAVIMSLSCAMVVVEAGVKGGTRAAGEEALRLKVPLFAIDYGFDEEMAPGNKILIDRGARKLKRSKDTGQPNLHQLTARANEYCDWLTENAFHESEAQASLL